MTLAASDVLLTEGRRSHVTGFLVALATGTTLCVIVPFLALANTPPAAYSTASWLAFAVMLFSGSRLAVLAGKGIGYMYSVTAWTFYYVFLGLAAFLQLRLDVSPDTTPNLIGSSLEPAMWVVILSALGIQAGMMIGNRLDDRGQRAARPGRDISTVKVAWMAVITFAVVGYVTARTGIGPLFESREALSAARQSAFPNPTFTALASGASLAFPLVSLHALVRVRRSQRARGEKPGLFLTTMFMAVTLLATINVISSARITFGTALLSLAILAGATSTVTRTRATILVLLTGLVFVFPAADAFRFTHSSTSVTSQVDVRLLAISGDYDAYAQIANTVAVTHFYGDTNWRQALGVALFWVPRSVWESKPPDTGVLVASERGYGFTNLSAPLPAEAYINGGRLAVLPVMLLFGIYLRRSDMAFARRRVDDVKLSAITGAVLPFFMLIVLRGSLLQAVGSLAALLAALWLVSSRPKDGRSA